MTRVPKKFRRLRLMRRSFRGREAAERSSWSPFWWVVFATLTTFGFLFGYPIWVLPLQLVAVVLAMRRPRRAHRASEDDTFD